MTNKVLPVLVIERSDSVSQSLRITGAPPFCPSCTTTASNSHKFDSKNQFDILLRFRYCIFITKYYKALTQNILGFSLLEFFFFFVYLLIAVITLDINRAKCQSNVFSSCRGYVPCAVSFNGIISWIVWRLKSSGFLVVEIFTAPCKSSGFFKITKQWKIKKIKIKQSKIFQHNVLYVLN